MNTAGRRGWRQARQSIRLPRTLGGRLVTGAFAIVLVVVLGVGTATYLSLRSFLLDRLDQQLIQTVDQSNVAGIWRDYNGLYSGAANSSAGAGSGPGGPIFRLPQRVWVEFVDDLTGRVDASSSASVNVLSLPARTRDQLAANLKHPADYTTTDGTHLRLLAIELRVTSAYTGVVQFDGLAFVGLSTGDIQDTLTRLLLLEIGIGTGVALLAVGATMYGVRATLRPLHRVTTTARDVAAELSPEGHGLQLRVPELGAEYADTEVGQLSTSVNTMLEAVETQFAARRASEERMRQFLADASHELRTPLTSIRGYAELSRLRRASAAAGGDPAPGDGAGELDRIEAEGTRMSRLVDDLLLLARTDRGGVPQFAPVGIGGLIDEVVDATRVAHPQRVIEVCQVDEATVYGDHDQLLRVLRNLVTNAAVHTDPAGPIQIQARTDGPLLRLTVTDAGPGLPPQEAAHVFERFWRADKARSRASGGSGLGLSIVETVVSAHGGTVHFDSSVDHGSTVTVTLPIHAPAHDASASPAPGNPAPGNPAPNQVSAPPSSDPGFQRPDPTGPVGGSTPVGMRADMSRDMPGVIPAGVPGGGRREWSAWPPDSRPRSPRT